ncbi:MAG TPA: FKBP-type peptidyl-prolyl cis-trans isomerase [Micromonosporaceae bacterium]|nr:FKBP-type peptidyl-prolyl cis-trans isomerase [Micromonosporaceae bacterium]
MSERAQGPRRDGSGDWQLMTKAERRKAARAAAAHAAKVRRRVRMLTRVLAVVAGIAVVTAVVVAVVASQDSTGSSAATTPTAGATSAAAFPPLPPGADPALRTKPSTGPGTGEVTKLVVTPLVTGQGPAATAGQRVTVNYVGVLYRTGAEFDASWTRSQPFTFQLGAGNVIQGWDQGLVGVRVGSRVQLDIPARLAYGDNPGGGRPAGPLRFVVDLLAAQ